MSRDMSSFSQIPKPKTGPSLLTPCIYGRRTQNNVSNAMSTASATVTILAAVVRYQPKLQCKSLYCTTRGMHGWLLISYYIQSYVPTMCFVSCCYPAVRLLPVNISSYMAENIRTLRGYVCVFFSSNSRSFRRPIVRADSSSLRDVSSVVTNHDTEILHWNAVAEYKMQQPAIVLYTGGMIYKCQQSRRVPQRKTKERAKNTKKKKKQALYSAPAPRTFLRLFRRPGKRKL